MIDDSMIVKSIHLYLHLYLARSHPNLIPTHTLTMVRGPQALALAPY